jgi:hypothetical protein
MQIATVKKQNGGYLVNALVSVPNDPFNLEYKKVQKWIANGGIVQDQFTLDEVKLNKIAEIKAIRDSKNVEAIVDTSAEILNTNGAGSGAFTYFAFYTDRHPINPAADPSSILTNAIVLNQSIAYSTQTVLGKNVTINLTPSLAKSIAAHLGLRNNNNYALANAIIVAINAASTKEQVEAITWNVKYL